MNRQMRKRIYRLFYKACLTPSEIDQKLGLASGTARQEIVLQWIADKNSQEDLRRKVSHGTVSTGSTAPDVTEGSTAECDTASVGAQLEPDPGSDAQAFEQ